MCGLPVVLAPHWQAGRRYQLVHASWTCAGLLQARYAEEPFVHVMDKGGVPHTRFVRGTNYNFISVFPDRLPGRAIIISGAHGTHSA